MSLKYPTLCIQDDLKIIIRRTYSIMTFWGILHQKTTQINDFPVDKILLSNYFYLSFSFTAYFMYGVKVI